MTNSTFPTLFSPGNMGRLHLENRIVMAPMVTCLATQEGRVSEAMLRYYTERARGGAGLIVVEATYPCSKGHPGRLLLTDDSFIPGLKTLVHAIRGNGPKVVLQLNPSRGRYDDVDPVSASGIPWPSGWPARALPEEEIVQLVRDFGDGAARAREAGFDGIQIHGAQGYLINDFLSPLSNKRDDSYGGDFEGRIRFPIDLLRIARERTESDFTIIFRYPGDDHVPGGWGVEEAKKFAQRLEVAGIDAVNITAGIHLTGVWTVPPMCLPPGSNVELARQIKAVVGVPVVAVGRIHAPALAEEVVAEGKADFVDMGRALLADPELPNKASAGQLEDIRNCIGCNQACHRVLTKRAAVACSVNASVGREIEFPVAQAKVRKRVLVIGGGPAGMEAARIAASRGHHVTLCESRDRLGGNLVAASAVSFKRDIRYLIEYLSRQIVKLGVKIELNTLVTPELAKRASMDLAIIATGASFYVPPLEGTDKPIVTGAREVLAGQAEVGDSVAVVGGGMMACETAVLLAQQGKQVSLVTSRRNENLALDMSAKIRSWLFSELWHKTGITLVPGRPEAVTDEGILVANGEAPQLWRADSVVFAASLKSNRELFAPLQKSVGQVFHIGDCVRPADIEHAITDGFTIGHKI